MVLSVECETSYMLGKCSSSKILPALVQLVTWEEAGKGIGQATVMVNWGSVLLQSKGREMGDEFASSHHAVMKVYPWRT